MRSSSMARYLLNLLLLSTVSAATIQARQETGSVYGDGYYQPSINGGSLLTFVDGTNPAGLKELINIIVSNISDTEVLGEGREAWMASIGFSSNCAGVVAENQHRADLGDGNGQKNETDIKRWNYGNYETGACTQTLRGGNHFRYWVQNGTAAASGALFLSASVEDDLDKNHRISEPNGYDAGRDEIVGNATRTEGTSALGYRFTATASTTSGSLEAGSEGINHGIPIDGNVAILTVKIVESGLPASSVISAAPASESTAVQAVVSSASLATSTPSTMDSGSDSVSHASYLSLMAAVLLVMI